MASQSNSGGSLASTSLKFDETSDLGSVETDINSPIDSASSLGVTDLPLKWGVDNTFSVQLDNQAAFAPDYEHYYHNDGVHQHLTTDVKNTIMSIPVFGGVSPILDTSMFELEPDFPGGYALIVFNVSSIYLQPGAPLDWLFDDVTLPIFSFKDGTGFAKACLTLDQLHHEAFTIDHNLKHFCEQPLGLGKGLKPLIVATKWVTLDMACHRLGANLVDRTKEVALAACMRDDDWFVQAATAWPTVTADRQELLPSLIDYLVVALGKIPVGDGDKNVLDLLCLVEVPAISTSSVMVFLRLAPTFDGSHWATGAIAQKLISDCLMYKGGWNWNSISHFLHPACPDILGTESASRMPRFVEPGSLTEAFIARRIGKTNERSAVPNARLSLVGPATRPATGRGNGFQNPGWTLETGNHTSFQNNIASPRRNCTRPNGIDVERIYRGLDVRTTVMLRNLPNRLSHSDLYDNLLVACPGEFDFLYVRIDFSNGCNVGYAFVNMISPQSVIGFVESFRGFRWPGSEKVAEVSYATQQGREALISRFRNSSVMIQPRTHRPKLYYPLGSPKAGTEEPFPKPDNLAKLHRSQQNAEAEGLYETRGRRGVAAGRRRAGMLDPHHTYNGGGMHDYEAMFVTPMTWPVHPKNHHSNGPQHYLHASSGHHLLDQGPGYEEQRRVQAQQNWHGAPRRGSRAYTRGH